MRLAILLQPDQSGPWRPLHCARCGWTSRKPDPIRQLPGQYKCTILILLYAKLIYSSTHLKLYPLASPHLGFPALNLAFPMAEYTYDSSYTTGSSDRPFTFPHNVYPAALMFLSAGEMSSDGTSGRTSCDSGSHSPNLSSVPRSVTPL